MNIKKTAKTILAEALSKDFDTELSDIESVIWTEMTEFLQTAYKMRKFQKQAEQYKDSRSMQWAAKYETDFDLIMSNMEKQKKEPSIDM